MDQIRDTRISVQGDLDGYSSFPAPKCTLVPKRFFKPEEARRTLAEVTRLKDSEQVDYILVPDYDAILIHSGTVLPELYHVLKRLPSCEEYNKILASYKDGYLSLGIAQGRTLLLANVYKAVDFTTAEYFLFLAMKTLQLNPEVSTICWKTPLTAEEEMSLYRYFKSVERI